MICTRCHVLCRDVCPKSGSRKYMRAPEDNEPVLLIVLTAMQAMLVEPILAESGIPYYKQGMVGGALAAQVGMMREVYSFYVPHSAHAACRDLIEQVFIEDETIMKLLHEYDVNEEKGE